MMPLTNCLPAKTNRMMSGMVDSSTPASSSNSVTPQAFSADAAFINAKGFGGNNATGVVLSPQVTERLLLQRHGSAAVEAWKAKRETVRAQAAAYLSQADKGHYAPRYQFGEAVLEGPELDIQADRIHIPGYHQAVSLNVDNPFGSLNGEGQS